MCYAKFHLFLSNNPNYHSIISYNENQCYTNSLFIHSAVESMVSYHYQHLQEVELDGAEISDIGIQQLSCCKQLKHLEMSFCECLTDQSLEYLMVCLL